MLLGIDLNGPARRRILHRSRTCHRASVFALQSACVNGAKLDAPETDSFASQLTVAALAIIASRYHAPVFQLLVIVAMIVQVIWRGLSSVVGS